MKKFLSVNAIGLGVICALSARPALAEPTISSVGQTWDIYTGQDVPPPPPPQTPLMSIPSVWYIVDAYVVADTTTKSITVSHSLTSTDVYGPTNWRHDVLKSVTIAANTDGVRQWSFAGSPYCYQVEGIPVKGSYDFTGATTTTSLLSSDSTATYVDNGDGGYLITFDY